MLYGKSLKSSSDFISKNTCVAFMDRDDCSLLENRLICGVLSTTVFNQSVLKGLTKSP